MSHHEGQWPSQSWRLHLQLSTPLSFLRYEDVFQLKGFLGGEKNFIGFQMWSELASCCCCCCCCHSTPRQTHFSSHLSGQTQHLPSITCLFVEALDLCFCSCRNVDQTCSVLVGFFCFFFFATRCTVMSFPPPLLLWQWFASIGVIHSKEAREKPRSGSIIVGDFILCNYHQLVLV